MKRLNNIQDIIDLNRWRAVFAFAMFFVFCFTKVNGQSSCEPLFFSSCSGSDANGIASVYIPGDGSIINDYAIECSNVAIHDKTSAFSVTLTSGQTYSAVTSVQYFSGYYAAIFIDVGSGFHLVGSSGPSQITSGAIPVFNIDIPLGMMGQGVLRVIAGVDIFGSEPSWDACGTYGAGSGVDYSVNVTSGDSYECPMLEANIGDPCDDNIESTINDVVIVGCECAGTPVILENTAALCSDGIDNDGDGLIDCEDPKCQAILNSLGCLTCFEDGLSFADEVIEYVSNCPYNLYPDPITALGMADGSAVSLGRGYIKLAFTNNTLVNSGNSDPDLFIFEVGPLVEPSLIELRPSNAATEDLCIAAGIQDSDGDGYYEFGGVGGSLASVDIDAFFDNLPPNSVFFDAIKVVDGPGNCATNSPGADIDAVCALSSVSCVVGAFCDDGNSDTENDVLNEDCECVGTPIVVFECAELGADFGDSCDDGNALTENDVVTADCECVGTSIYSCPEHEANVGDVCDDGDEMTEDDVYNTECECAGTPIVVWDCPELEANIGHLCDDGDASTQNDVLGEDCECAGTPIVIEFECPQYGANIGDPCELPGAIGELNADCECVPVIIPDCEFVYYISDHDAADGISDIYGVTLSGGVATMTHIAQSPIEVHIAYHAEQKLIYAISKHTNSYRTLDPANAAWGPVVPLNKDLGQVTAAVFNHDGKLLLGSQNHKVIYSVNVTTNMVSTYDTYSPLNGGDLAFGSDGMLYMATRSGNGLYQVWTAPVNDNLIGSLPTKVTGMAITDADQLLISAQGNSSLVLRNTNGSDPSVSYSLMLNGEAYTLRDGDMASGCKAPDDVAYCPAFRTFLVNHGAGISGSDIYSVKFFNGNANLTFLTNVTYETHIAFNGESNTLYLVNVDGSFVRSYDVALDAFIGDTPILGDFTKLTAVVYNWMNGLLYVGDHHANKIYTLDPVTGLSAYYADAPVSGGDLEILDDGFLYLGSKAGAGLYQIVPGGSAIPVGNTVPSITGMGRIDDFPNNFIISENGASVLTEIFAGDGSTLRTYPIMLDAVPFTLTDGDMASGCADDATPVPPINPLIAVESNSVLTTYPNPTKGQSKVVFTTGETTRTLVEVYDMNGRNVGTLFNEEAQKGKEYTIDFNGNNLSNGVYIYRLTTDHETIIEKFMIAR